MPPLPVLPPARSDPLRLFHRAMLQRSRAVAADEVTLTGGTWLRNPALPLPAANCVLDASIDPGGDPAAVVAQAADAHCPVRGWTLNPSLSPDRTAPLAEYLLRTGWHPAPLHVLRLDRLTAGERTLAADVTIVPTRSAYGPFRRLMADRFATAVEAEAAELLLDDAHVDAWVALRAGRPVAAVSLLNDGQTGTITDLYAAAAHADLAGPMLRRAAEAAGRAGHALLLAAAADVAAYAAVGFTPVGQWVQYVRPAASRAPVGGAT